MVMATAIMTNLQTKMPFAFLAYLPPLLLICSRFMETIMVMATAIMTNLQTKMPFAKPSRAPAVDDDEHPGFGSSPPPAHYTVPDEPGRYFPAGSDEASALLAEIDNVSLHRIHPRRRSDSDGPIATGTLTLKDPDAGTADDVALVGRCGDLAFYVMGDDATIKASESRFYLMLPRECIAVDLAGCSEGDVLRVESLLAARTRFHDATAEVDGGEPESEGPIAAESSDTDTSKVVYPDGLPGDFLSRKIFWSASKASKLLVAAGERGASQIDAYGEKKRGSITKSRDVKVGDAGIAIAKGARTVAEKTYEVTEKASGKISDYLGGRVGRAAAMKEGDSAARRRARSLLLASAMSCAEIGDGASEGYEIVVRSAQMQATEYVAKKYGRSAAELCRHTAGAAANFGRAALTARRVVDVKKLAKAAGKRAVKEGIKASI